MSITSILYYGIILGVVEIVLLLISTWGTNSDETNLNAVFNIIVKFIICNIMFVAILNKVG